MGAVYIDGHWHADNASRRYDADGFTATRYTATGTKGESIELRHAHRSILTVTPVDGEAKAVELGPKATFDHAEDALLVWGQS